MYFYMSCHIMSFHSRKKRKDSLKTRVVLLIFSLERDIYAVTVQGIHQNSKNSCFYCFSEEFHSENTFCCYDYGASASEAVEKIATDQEDYRKCSLCVIVCCIAKAYHQ